MKKNVIFVFCGNCRTFLECIDNTIDKIIFNLTPVEEFNIFVYFYLKLKNPGPRNEQNYNFTYTDLNHDYLLNKINIIKEKYNNLFFDYKILEDNEISDNELLLQIKDRSKYIGQHYGNDEILLRGVHCHYNFEKCGQYILNKEKENITFDYIIYIRPDLYFSSNCQHINNYSSSKVTLARCYEGDSDICTDHFAIIPRNYFYSFFFGRMDIYRNNEIIEFSTPEDVYLYTIDYILNRVGFYTIRREIILN